MYGSTKVGIIGKHVAAMATPPTSQPDDDTQDGLVDDQSQATRSQLMRREGCQLTATRARGSVTRTIGTPPPHGPVVSFDFVYSRGLGKFDTGSSFFWGGPRVPCCNRPRSSFFYARLAARRNKHRGGVPDRIYRSGVKSGMPAGSSSDNLIKTTAGYAG